MYILILPCFFVVVVYCDYIVIVVVVICKLTVQILFFFSFYPHEE